MRRELHHQEHLRMVRILDLPKLSTRLFTPTESNPQSAFSYVPKLPVTAIQKNRLNHFNHFQPSPRI
jgi:hypothetical protein